MQWSMNKEMTALQYSKSVTGFKQRAGPQDTLLGEQQAPRTKGRGNTLI